MLKLEKVTLECIRKTLQEIEDTKGAPFNPGEKIHLLTGQILAILVCYILLSLIKNDFTSETSLLTRKMQRYCFNLHDNLKLPYPIGTGIVFVFVFCCELSVG